ncbi:LamG domain-containing protein [Candidatus Poribacteria bacterium]|jgi:hypothetical protein|nr:LamG domain-containing protein [Candidatus Poribacteria bacterium]MBT5533953.1 LamG domain-containing protein [Candidatus Poribacteria bacterium]MBT5710550.1 LamG domain-containing protein [Candidatus Poribacteria bacterium]MBT7100844.1 LamG domain-containing protein [Candidatus Poribacteria bacterium]MBT7805188.1 LamG domain-containing protein [Candidatus Poribacteria bacterium]
MRLSTICVPLLLTTCVAFARVGQVLPQPLLWLQFDEGDGDIAADGSGNGNDATLHGDVEWVTGFRGTEGALGTLGLAPDEGGAVRFGENRWAVVPHDDMFHLTDDMTVACWVKLEGDGEDDGMSYQQAVFEKGPVWGAGLYSLMPDFNNNVLFQARDLLEGCNDELQGGYILGVGWTHIAGTFDGESIRVYVNGELADDLDCPGELQTNDEDLYIGSRAGAERWVLGVVDELYVFNVALSEEQVKHLYAPPSSVFAAQWHELKSGTVAPMTVGGN